MIEEESLLSDEEDWEGIEGTELERTFGKAASFLEKLVLDPTSNIGHLPKPLDLGTSPYSSSSNYKPEDWKCTCGNRLYNP